MSQIESTVNSQLPHLSLDPAQTPQPMDLLDMLPNSFRSSRFELGPILEHWRARRLKREGKSIIPIVQYEDIPKNEIDPYVCFRRREIKPVRKTRRTDQQSFERLRKLRMEMEKARGLLEMVLRREKIRRESLFQEHAVFEKRCEIREYQRLLGIKDEEALMPATKKKRKTAMDTGSSTTIKIPLSRLRRDAADNTDRHDKTPAQLAMEAELAKKREADAPYEDVTECPYQPFPLELPMQFFQTFSSPNTVNDVAAATAAPRFRKRIGRGGRVFIDRVGYRGPSQSRDPFQFDPDYEEMEEVETLDEMDDRFLRHRVQLLSVDQLRNFVDLPSLLQGTRNTQRQGPPTTTSNTNGSVAAAAAAANVASQPKNVEAGVSFGPTTGAGVGAAPVKRQNSRQRLTPQQASVAMANGMIAANLSAHVNGTMSNRAPLRQQPQQQRALPISSNGSPLQQPTPPPQKPTSSPSPQLSPQRPDLQQQQQQQAQPQRYTATAHVS
ncbi:hypothetical protein BDB00DRAFT_857951 [Zychaea mexicana]|uniref:uncharacterized protein n=1 Tax=Zychaea mexicana TaxID=64656 RepID=UPI0022FDC60A|nr:uncharacterized protein BDB00DRAFT_857951 [Zychaea mexicana]KAI9480243.1 hypothetical protein BDB00DRAFT_857951 [Zychaea mexicana]